MVIAAGCHILDSLQDSRVRTFYPVGIGESFPALPVLKLGKAPPAIFPLKRSLEKE
jgi:hypothetical protein